MADRYLARAESLSAVPPNPLIPAGLTIAVPVVVVLVGWALLNTVALDNSTGHAVSYGGVRSAITQVLEKDLAADRLQDLLTDLPDHPLTPATPIDQPAGNRKDESSRAVTDAKTDAGAKDGANGQDDGRAREEAKAKQAQADAKAEARRKEEAQAFEKQKTERKTERTARLKLVVARLNGERARLADRLTSVALTPHPGRDASLNGERRADVRRQRMGAIVDKRLAPGTIDIEAQKWVLESVDGRTRALIENTVAAPPVKPAGPAGSPSGESLSVAFVARAIAASLSSDAVRRSASGVVALPFNAFDTRPGEAAWTSDIAARLAWAVVALVFMLTFGIVAFTSIAQIWCVAPPSRRIFALATAAIAIVAGVLTAMALSPASGTTPLHLALREYAHLFGVGVIRWADVNNALRGAGLVLLVAGSVATFWVKVSTAEELREQLRGFKSLFNAGAIFLMTGTFEVFAGFRWPIVFAGDEATRTALQDAAAAFATTVGAGFAVVMLATYITTTAVLRQQAIAHGVPPADVATELETAGFSDLISQQTLRFAQALAPLIPGVFTVLLS